jgi:hypothetical protein
MYVVFFFFFSLSCRVYSATLAYCFWELVVHLNPHAGLDSEGRPSFYPIVFPNDFWLLREQMYPINDTVKELPLAVTFYPLSHLKFQVSFVKLSLT